MNRYSALMLGAFIACGAVPAQGEYCVSDTQKICCDNGTGSPAVYPKVCLDFDGISGAPEIGSDFDLTFDANDVPSVQLILGKTASVDRKWQIWSEDASGDEDEMGSITIVDDDGTYQHDFYVKLLNSDGTTPGASTMGNFDLEHPDGSWSGHSEITGGIIAGQLDGDLITIEDSGGDGGSVNLTIQGDVTGDIDVGTIVNGDTLRIGTVTDPETIGGSVEGTTTIAAIADGGEVWIDEIEEQLVVAGTLDGDLRIDSILQTSSDDYDCWIKGVVGSTAMLTFDAFAASTDTHLTALRFGDWDEDSRPRFKGDIRFLSDLNEGRVWFGGTLGGTNFDSFTTVVTGEDLATPFIFQNGTHPKTQITFDAVKAGSHMCLAFEESDNEFAGTLTINEDFEMYGEIQIDHSGCIDGTIHIKGDMAGKIASFYPETSPSEHTGTIQVDGDVLSSGGISAPYASWSTGSSIEIGGTVDAGLAFGTVYSTGAFKGTIETGTVLDDGSINVKKLSGSITVDAMNLGSAINVTDDLNGDITIGGDADGDITVQGDAAGDLTIQGDAGGDITLDRLYSRGRILVDGVLDGPITIDKGTSSTSAMEFSGGIDQNGSIEINDSGGDYSADGDILIGVDYTPLPNIKAAGCLVINVYETIPPQPESYGDLNGDIDIVGCHDDDIDLNICVHENDGTISFDQGGCSSQYTLTYSCQGSCAS